MQQSLNDKRDDLYFDKVSCRIGSESTRHFHDAVEIYYLRDGKCNYFIGEHYYEVLPGDVVIIPGGTVHRTNYGMRPHSRVLVNFPSDILSDAIADLIPKIGHHYRNAETRGRIDELFCKIEEEYNLSDQLTPEAIGCYISELLLLFARKDGDVKGESEAKGPVSRAVKYLHENFGNDVKLSLVARELSVSSEHLSRAFKKETGFGFNEYLTLIRLRKAEYMLRNEPGRSVGEVAYTCGFNDSNYFSYKFKKLYGIPPLRIRKNGEKEK